MTKRPLLSNSTAFGRAAFALCFTLFLSGKALSEAAPQVLHETVTGTPDLGSIDVIAFAPGGVLLIGDGAKAQILAVQVPGGETASVAYGTAEGITSEIAGHLGTTLGDVEIVDMAVEPESQRVYFAVRKQSPRADMIITLHLTQGGEREYTLFPLEAIPHVVLPLPQGDKAKPNRITDVVWAGDRVVAAARCNEEFASKIYAAEAPLRHQASGQLYSAETYHISHRKWETRAPMSVMIPYEEDGKQYIVGAFSCTPVVKYPIEAIEPGAKIKGISMIELGSGNRPLDMFSYTKDGKPNVITNTFRFHHEKRPFGPSPYWACRFDEDLLASTAVNEAAIRRLKGTEPTTEKISMAEAFHGVVHMDRIGDKHALALRATDQEGEFDLATLSLP